MNRIQVRRMTRARIRFVVRERKRAIAFILSRTDRAAQALHEQGYPLPEQKETLQ